MTLQKVLHKIALFGVMAVPLIPLVWSNELFFPFISARGFFFRIVVETVFAAWVILALKDNHFRPKGSLVLWTLVIFTGVIFLADIFGISPYKSLWSNFERMEGFITLAHLFLYFLVSGAVLKEVDWGRFFRISIGVSFFVSLYAILQLFHELSINQGSVRVDGTLGNALYLAAYLLLHIFLILFLVFGRRFKDGRGLFLSAGTGLVFFGAFYLYKLTGENFNLHLEGGLLALVVGLLLIGLAYLYKQKSWLLAERIERYFLFGLVILETVILFYTATRGAALGLIGGAVVASGFMIMSSLKNGDRVAKRVSVAVLALVGLLLALFFVFKDTPAIRNNPVFGRLASISIQNEDAQARFVVWNIALKGFKDRSVLGFGQDNFNYVFNTHYDPNLYKREPWFDRAHNTYLDWLVAGGAAGFLAYLAVVFALLLSIFRLSRGGKNVALNDKEKAVLLGLFAGYAIHNFFAFDILPTYFVIFSLMAYLHFKTTEQTSAPIFSGKTFRLNSGVVSGVFVTLVFIVYFLNGRPILAGVNLINALHLQPEGPVRNYEYFIKALSYKSFADSEIREQLSAAAVSMKKVGNVPDNIRNDFLDLTLSEFKKQIDERPADARYYLMLAVFLDEYSQFPEALPYLLKAEELSPNKQEIIIEIGTNYLNQQKFEDALLYFKKAFELAPDFEDIRIIYAVGAIYADKNDLVEELLIPKYGTTLIPDHRIARAYFNRGELSKVIALWERAIKDRPDDGSRYLYLAGAYLEAGRKTEAIAAIKKAADVSPELKTQVEFYLKELGVK